MQAGRQGGRTAVTYGTGSVKRGALDWAAQSQSKLALLYTKPTEWESVGIHTFRCLSEEDKRISLEI